MDKAHLKELHRRLESARLNDFFNVLHRQNGYVRSCHYPKPDVKKVAIGSRTHVGTQIGTCQDCA